MKFVCSVPSLKTKYYRHGEAEEFGAALVRSVTAPEGVEGVLEHGQPAGGLARTQRRIHGTVALVIDAEGVAVGAELPQVVQQLVAERWLHRMRMRKRKKS